MNWFDRFAARFRRSPSFEQVSAPVSIGRDVALAPREPSTLKAAADAGPRFRTMATDYLNRGKSDSFTNIRLKLREAFRPSKPVVEASMLAGREQILAQVIQAIEDRHLHPVLFGDRGIGKTSLLMVLAAKARQARYLVSYVSCGAEANFDETFRAIASEIPLIYHQDYGPTSAEGERGATVADILPSGPIQPRTASEYCAKIQGTRVLVVLDEFERAREPEFRRAVGELLKNLSDRSTRVHVAVAGVAASVDDLVQATAVMQRNIIAIEVPRMTREEVETLIRNGERVSGLTYDPGAVDILISASNGMPFLAGLLAQQTGFVALDRGRQQVAEDDVLVALHNVVVEIGDRLSRALRAAVHAAIKEGSPKILNTLAGSPLISDFQVAVSEIPSIFPDTSEAAAAQAEIERLMTSGVLICRTFRGEPYLAFQDPNACIYMWLLTVSAFLQPSPERGRKAPAEAEPVVH